MVPAGCTAGVASATYRSNGAWKLNWFSTVISFGGAPTPFSRCTPAEQDARLEAWRRSRFALLRSGYQAVKRLADAAYYSSPEIYALVGYPGPPLVPQLPGGTP